MTTSTGHTIQTDVPIKMGGKNEAPQPVELLLAAFIGCTQATALFVGRQMKPDRIILDKMEFDIQAVRDEQGALSLPIDQDPKVPTPPNLGDGKCLRDEAAVDFKLFTASVKGADGAKMPCSQHDNC